MFPASGFRERGAHTEFGRTDTRKNTMNNWLPKSVLCLKSYTKRLFVADLLAGVTVGLVALPLAMAFAIASGVPPQDGRRSPKSASELNVIHVTSYTASPLCYSF